MSECRIGVVLLVSVQLLSVVLPISVWLVSDVVLVTLLVAQHMPVVESRAGPRALLLLRASAATAVPSLPGRTLRPPAAAAYV